MEHRDRPSTNAKLQGLVGMVLMTIAAVGLAAVVIGLFAPNTGYGDNVAGLRIELIKWGLQVLSTGVIGFVATLVSAEWNRQRAEAEKDVQKQREQREARRLAREQFRTTLSQAYMEQKRLRRLLRANAITDIRNDGSFRIRVESYDRYMTELMKVQIELEMLDDDFALRQDLFALADPAPVTVGLRTMEDTLRQVLKEYERRRHVMHEDRREHASTFPMLSGYTGIPSYEGQRRSKAPMLETVVTAYHEAYRALGVEKS